MPKGPKPRPATDRFWDHVTRGSTRDCWEWDGSRSLSGYGVIAAEKRGRVYLAHRLSWEIHHGPIPAGLCVLHRCDNPPCVNPRHLWLGTKADNNRDRGEKGRGRESRQSGLDNPGAKLTEGEAREVVALVAAGWTQQAVADKFGISQPQVSRIVRGESWHRL